METAPISSIKPIPYLHSYTIKEEKDGKKLQRSRLKIKNLVLYEYKMNLRWKKLSHFIKIKRTCLAHLKGLSGLCIPQAPLQIPSIMTFHKQICYNLQKLKINASLSSIDLNKFEKHLNKMKHLTSFIDSHQDFGGREKCLSNLNCFRKVRSLDLPCHMTPKKLDRFEKISIDLEKLCNSRKVLKLPLSLRELSLTDKNPENKYTHETTFSKVKDQLNSLSNLKVLNLVFPKKSYYQQSNLFSDLELRNLTITLRTQVNFSETMLLEMEDYVERTGSEIKIIPSGFSQPEEYLRLLSFLRRRKESNKQGIQLEKVLYPFKPKGNLQREIIEYYLKMSKTPNQVEFIFELHSDNGWFDEQNISNFKEMMEISHESKTIHHFIQNGHFQLPETMQNEIAQVAIDLLKDKELERGIITKVSSDLDGFHFKMLKSFISKLFEGSSYPAERIYWEQGSRYISGLSEMLDDLKAKRFIKYYSLVIYQKPY